MGKKRAARVETADEIEFGNLKDLQKSKVELTSIQKGRFKLLKTQFALIKIQAQQEKSRLKAIYDDAAAGGNMNTNRCVLCEEYKMDCLYVLDCFSFGRQRVGTRRSVGLRQGLPNYGRYHYRAAYT